MFVVVAKRVSIFLDRKTHSGGFPNEVMDFHLTSQSGPPSAPLVAKLSYLWELASLTSLSSRHVSRVALSEFIQEAKQAGLSIPQNIRNKFCQKCSSLLVESISSHGRFKSTPRKRENNQKGRVVSYLRIAIPNDSDFIVVFSGHIVPSLR